MRKSKDKNSVLLYKIKLRFRHCSLRIFLMQIPLYILLEIVDIILWYKSWVYFTKCILCKMYILWFLYKLILINMVYFYKIGLLWLIFFNIFTFLLSRARKFCLSSGFLTIQNTYILNIWILYFVNWFFKRFILIILISHLNSKNFIHYL